MKSELRLTAFDNFVKALRKSGYTVKVDNKEGYLFAAVGGKWIMGGFADKGSINAYINGKIAFDNVKCFDKLSKCPYILPLPKNEAQFNYVLEKMQYLATPDGYKRSNECALKPESKYPSNKTKL